MAGEILTPNMSLPNPGVGVTSGPQYATDIYNCMTIIDGHTHTSGSGVPITTAAININANLSFNSFSAYNLNALTLNVLSGVVPNQSLYVTGVDLYYIDGNGNQIKITSGGTVNATSSGISSGAASASFVGGVLVVKASSTVAANIDVASVILRNPTSNSFGLTLSPPSALSSNYGLILPTIPAQTNVMTLDSSGNMGSTTWDQVGVNMTSIGANAVIASTTRATGSFTEGIGGVPTSLSSGTFVTSSTTPQLVTNLSITLTTSGRPVNIMLIDDGTLAGSSVGITNAADYFLSFYRNGTQISAFFLQCSGSALFDYVVSSFIVIDPTIAGTYTYTVKAACSNGSGAISVTNTRLLAYEL